MKLNERHVAVVLTGDGRQTLAMAAAHTPETGAVLAYVQDTDDLGLWVRVNRPDGYHFLLIRWEYILSVDLPAGDVTTVGMRP